MNKSSWRKRLAVLRSRLYLYPAPEKQPRTRLFWFSLALVTLLAVVFSTFFIAYQMSRQDAFQTAAEDMGIMDQAVWSITHGQLLHQTICNVVSDTNCYSPDGISRFAIHFEPILFPVALLYMFWPGPKFLLILQTLVVASGAFPAFLLARLRLRNELAAVGIAALYLLYPALQQAEIFEFHAVTLTTALLMFTLYFLYTRRTVWMFVFAILAMACKEQLPGVIALFGLWAIIFQQRWRSGLGLLGLAFGWLGLTLLIYHFFSPTGHALLSSRYSYLGNSPIAILKNFMLHPRKLLYAHVLDSEHRTYLRILLAPAGYLPLLAPWVLILAAPSIALNLFSSDRNQHLGVFQYSAEIVPILIFATIEAMVLLIWLLQWAVRKWREQHTASRPALVTAEASESPTTPASAQKPASRRWERWLQPVALALLSVFALVSVFRMDATYGALPYSRGFGWPHVGTHELAAQHIIAKIPPNASVSAQSSLVPHISQRESIYLFPYGIDRADYIFLDVTSYTYPYESGSYLAKVKQVLLGGNYGVVVAEDGYLLLKHGLPSPGVAPGSLAQTGPDAVPNLPASFCSFVQSTPSQVQQPLQVDFTPQQAPGTLSLLGFHAALPNSFSVITRFLQVTTYWKVSAAPMPPLRLQTLLFSQNGKQLYASMDFPALSWCPTNVWQPGAILRIVSSPLYIGNVPDGLARISLALLPFAVTSGTMETKTARVPFHILHASGGVMALTGATEQNVLQLQTFTVAF